jgi:AcrR family transcriptional regulator
LRRRPAAGSGERRQQLLEATRRAVRRIGPEASMDEIAAEAGITKPILYRHFESRVGLATAVTDDYSTEFLAHVTERVRGSRTPADLMRLLIDAYLEFVERDPALFAFNDERGFGRSAALGHTVQSRRPLQRGVSFVLHNALASQGRDPAPAETWGHAISGMLAAGARWWLDDRRLSREELVRHLYELIWYGVAGAGRPR